MGIEIGRFCPGNMMVQATGTEIWSLGMGKNVKNQKWEFRNCEVGFGKK